MLISRLKERVLINRRVSRRIKIAAFGFWTGNVRRWISRRFPHCRPVKIIRYLPRLVQIVTNREPEIEILRLILLIFLTFHRFTTLLHACDARGIQRNVQSLLQKLLHSFLVATSLARIA